MRIVKYEMKFKIGDIVVINLGHQKSSKESEITTGIITGAREVLGRPWDDQEEIQLRIYTVITNRGSEEYYEKNLSHVSETRSED